MEGTALNRTFLWQAGSICGFKTTLLFSQKNVCHLLSYISSHGKFKEGGYPDFIQSTFGQIPIQRLIKFQICTWMRTVVSNCDIWASLKLKYLISNWIHWNPQVLNNQHGTKIQLNIQKLVSDVTHMTVENADWEVKKPPRASHCAYAHFSRTCGPYYREKIRIITPTLQLKKVKSREAWSHFPTVV